MIGETISHYRIVREIGHGGMGAVYEAEDLKLGRRIALKLLGAQFAEDEERRRRFAREARAVAAINHPNIVTIFSVEESDDFSFLTMELIQGRCLSEIIPEEGFEYPDWLAVARPLVDAVAAAHRAGITHRDLKPENIMINGGGLKVLDFGLAKVVDVEGPDSTHSLVDSQTMTTYGQIMGTAAYMSPEQAEGKPVDRRSDIFSLGSVLFEMATGRAPFVGDSPLAVLSSVIRDEVPPLVDLNPRLAPHVGPLIQTCLFKSADARWPSAVELHEQIVELPGEPSKTLPIRRAPSSQGHASSRNSKISQAQLFLRRNKRLAWLSIAAAGIAIASVVFAMSRAVPLRLEPRTIVPVAVEGSLSESPSWSPDGEWIVYASNRDGTTDLWRKSLTTLEAQRLTNSEYNEGDPAWSPDGEMIAYSSDQEGGGLFVMRAVGGEPFRVAAFGARPSWSPDGRLLAFEWYGRVYVTPIDGGEPRMLFLTDGFPRPVFSPDGTKLVFWNQIRQDVCTGTLEGEQLACLDVLAPAEEVAGLAWSRDGRFLIVSKGSFGGAKDLWQVPMAADGTRRNGEAERLSATPFHDVQACISPDGGRIAYSSQRVERHLWAYELDPASGMPRVGLGPVRLTVEGQNSVYPALSTDGSTLAWTAQTYARGSLFSMSLVGDEPGIESKLSPEQDLRVREVHASFSATGSIVYSSVRGGSYELWRLPSPGAPVLQVTNTEAGISDTSPSWSPDGQSIAFQSTRDGEFDIWTVSVDGSGWSEPVRRTPIDGVNARSPVWSPDGRYIAHRQGGDSPDIWLLDTETWEGRPFEEHPADEFWSAWSPDGSRLYFTSNRLGTFNVWIKPIDGTAEASQVTFHRRGEESGLPVSNLYTRFAVANSSLVVPLETRHSEIYVLETERQ